jgi:hypothetical protein
LRALTAAAGLVSLGLLISGVLRPPAAVEEELKRTVPQGT